MIGTRHEDIMNSEISDKATHPRRGLAIGLVLSTVAAIVLVGCSSPASSAPSSVAPSSVAPSSGAASNDEGATVTVTLTEWAVILDKTSAPAGKVLFNVTNAGTQFKHEFVVIKTDLAPDALPADSTGRVDEEAGAGITYIGEVEELEIGATGNVSLPLTAGKYVLICNIVEAGGGHESHYNMGMRVTFTVT
jgi:uncharacterized cupredoxin-like copper-binding protein